MILLIDNYDSFTFNLVHFLGEIGAETKVVRNDQIAVDDALAMPVNAIILSPGPCTPNEAGICLELVEKAPADLPIFGVCLGHQTIGQAFGGQVIRAPEIMHGKRSKIHHNAKGIFASIPQDFDATRYHSLMIEASSLPDCLEATAHTPDGMIMGVQHKTRPVFGVQFHPESIASLHGHQMLANFIEIAGLKPRLDGIKTQTLAELR
ncbi:MAG: anthranilate synthase component II [Parvibaculales bacterium]